MGAAESVTAVLVYRMISYLLVSLIGWVVILVMFRGTYRTDSDVDVVEKEVDEQILDHEAADDNLVNSDPDPPVVRPSDERPDPPGSVR
jgi:hypothetical protein